MAAPETRPPLVGFAAFSGSGKTTLLTRLLAIFRERRVRVGVIKHAHHDFDTDTPGKDSYELRKAGARQVLIGSPRRRALVVETPEGGDDSLTAFLACLDLSGLDLVLVEGFKFDPLPKIEVHRPALGHPLLFPNDPHIIAVVTDGPLPVPTDLPRFDLNDVPGIARFIVDRFLPAPQTGGHGIS